MGFCVDLLSKMLSSPQILATYDSYDHMNKRIGSTLHQVLSWCQTNTQNVIFAVHKICKKIRITYFSSTLWLHMSLPLPCFEGTTYERFWCYSGFQGEIFYFVFWAESDILPRNRDGRHSGQDHISSCSLELPSKVTWLATKVEDGDFILEAKILKIKHMMPYRHSTEEIWKNVYKCTHNR